MSQVVSKEEKDCLRVAARLFRASECFRDAARPFTGPTTFFNGARSRRGKKVKRFFNTEPKVSAYQPPVTASTEMKHN